MLDVLSELARLRMQQGDAEQALGLALLLLAHPAAPYEAKERAERLCAEARGYHGLPEAAAGEWARGHTLGSAAGGLFVEAQ